MDKLINYIVDNDLSGTDVQRICFDQYPVIIYSDLVNYSSIDEVLGENLAFILLFQNTKLTGHWCCVWKQTRNTICFFDSYAIAPDAQLNLATYVKVPYLTQLFKKSGCHIDANTYELQKFTTKVNTCGRWCGIRLRFRNLSHKKFHQLFTENKQYSPDFWVCALTLLINEDDERDTELMNILGASPGTRAIKTIQYR